MNSINALLPWHQAYWQQLQAYLQQKRIPQALLIVGAEGLGKQQLAEQFTAALLCNTPQANGMACGQCHDCRLYFAQTHPDVITVSRAVDKTSISVEQIRQLVSQLSLKPQYAGYRIVLFQAADSMNSNAANALLKCLEEPSERSVLILITDKPSKLPATILSRCQQLTLSKPDASLASAWLQQQQPELDSQQRQNLLQLAQGAPYLALSYAKTDVLTLYNRCFKTWIALAKQQSHPVLIAEEWHKLPNAMLLNWMALWLLDLLKCRFHAEAQALYNPNLASDLLPLAQTLSATAVIKFYDQLLAQQKQIHTPINKQMLFEALLIQWVQLNQQTKLPTP